jgi:hypothetical protein
MRYFFRLATIVLCLLVTVFLSFSCEKKKEGKVIITEQEFSLRKVGSFSYSLDATGKIKNIGEVDVKKIVVTGYCRSCGEAIINGHWFVSDTEKMPNQKATINYLPTGYEEEFSFQEIALHYGKADEKPQNIPDNLEIVIESFEVVE